MATFDRYAAAHEALCDDCGEVTCRPGSECGIEPPSFIRQVEMENRRVLAELELADLTREVADAHESQPLLAERMALRRVVRWLDGQCVEEWK